MIGLTFKNPLLAGCEGITEWTHTVEKWLKAGAGGILAKTITTDPKLRSSIRPIFYTLSKYGLKGADSDLMKSRTFRNSLKLGILPLRTRHLKNSTTLLGQLFNLAV